MLHNIIIFTVFFGLGEHKKLENVNVSKLLTCTACITTIPLNV